MACILNGFQTVASIFMQQIEQPIKALALSLSRQIVFLIPLALIFPRIWGIDGVLYAGPAADTLAFLLAFILVFTELKKYKQHGPVEKGDTL